MKKRTSAIWFLCYSLFQKGIVIIDSPGVGESDIMDEIVTEYLPRAFAFIYTINSSNAGGVQKDRVSDYLVKLKVIYTTIVTICSFNLS